VFLFSGFFISCWGCRYVRFRFYSVGVLLVFINALTLFVGLWLFGGVSRSLLILRCGLSRFSVFVVGRCWAVGLSQVPGALKSCVLFSGCCVIFVLYCGVLVGIWVVGFFLRINVVRRFAVLVVVQCCLFFGLLGCMMCGCYVVFPEIWCFCLGFCWFCLGRVSVSHVPFRALLDSCLS